MGGMPSTVMHTDSISLKNANWFLGISESDYEGGDYGTWYSYLYFGDFDKQKMLIQFYKYQYDLKDIDEFNKIVESIRIIN